MSLAAHFYLFFYREDTSEAFDMVKMTNTPWMLISRIKINIYQR